MNTPKWAQDLTLETLLYLESKGHKVVVPDITWRHGKRDSSSGHANPKEYHITITAGHNRTDAKLVLLHEITHLNVPSEPKYWNIERAKKQGWHFNEEPKEPIVIKTMYHTDKFWELAFALYRWAKLPMRYCLQREKEYRKGAAIAYKRSKSK